MTFKLFWIDYWTKERLFGFGFITVSIEDAEGEPANRSVLSAYYADGVIFFDLLGIRFTIV